MTEETYVCAQMHDAMALRAHNGPAPECTSAKVGERVAFRAKIENTAAAPETVALVVEGLTEGALARPVDFVFSFEPATIAIRPKTRENVAFIWTAALPEGKPAFTFRGKLVLKTTTGETAGSAKLDLYVSS
jgi:hypothetical protein